MNPELETRLKSEAERFELLEHPEHWPDDPALQAELADLLELHLALQAHGSELQADLRPRSSFQRLRSNSLMAAAALLLAVVPSLFVVQRNQAMHRQRATIEASAQRRAQARNWSTFFEQSSELIKRFDRNPPLCDKEHEDRNEERVLALALLEVSRQLEGQTVNVPEAETARNELHFWLTELSTEEGCLSPERAQELRQLASNQNLEHQAQRLGELLKGEGS